MNESKYDQMRDHVEYAVFLAIEDARDSARDGIDVDTNALTADIMASVDELVKYVKENIK
jgi:hypothetical protein